MRSALRVVVETVRFDIAEVRAIYTWRTWLFGWLLRLFFQAMFFAMIGRYLGAGRQMRYVLIGNIVVLLCLEVTVVVISMGMERRSGTLPLLAIAPMSHLPLYLGRGLHWVVTGLTSTLIAWLVLPPALGVHLPWPEAGFAIPVFLAIAFSSYGFGCVLAAVALRRPGLQWLVLNLGYMSVMAFCGVNVPTGFWPIGIQLVADLLPVNHGLSAVRDILADAGPARVLPEVGLELLVGLGWFAVAALAVDRLVSAGRRDGSLEYVG